MYLFRTTSLVSITKKIFYIPAYKQYTRNSHYTYSIIISAFENLQTKNDLRFILELY